MPNTDFIGRAAPPAQASQRDFGVPASVTIAQAILESGWGQHHIGDANNYFGIKAVRRPDGTVYFGSIATGFVEVPTREVINGRDVMVRALFRSYPNMEASFRDHGAFLRNNGRYAPAFQVTNNPDEFARAIHRAGYATDPRYADVLIGIMNTYNLKRFDSGGAVPPPHPTPDPDPGPVVKPTTWPLVRRGDAGPTTAAIQLLLNAHGANLVPDGVFGERTDAAVRSFQASQGLSADGVVGPQTWQRLITTVRVGSAGMPATALRALLIAHGASLTAGGDFDSGVLAAVRAFQSQRGLDPDGIVGPKTWQALLNAG